MRVARSLGRVVAVACNEGTRDAVGWKFLFLLVTVPNSCALFIVMKTLERCGAVRKCGGDKNVRERIDLWSAAKLCPCQKFVRMHSTHDATWQTASR